MADLGPNGPLMMQERAAAAEGEDAVLALSGELDAHSSGRLAQQLDIDPFVLEIAQPLREDRRQVDLLLDTADHQGHVGALGRP